MLTKDCGRHQIFPQNLQLWCILISQPIASLTLGLSLPAAAVSHVSSMLSIAASKAAMFLSPPEKLPSYLKLTPIRQGPC